jgi:hypothetical protein
MPPDGYNSITIPDEVCEQLTEVMIGIQVRKQCRRGPTASAALEHDEATFSG